MADSTALKAAIEAALKAAGVGGDDDSNVAVEAAVAAGLKAAGKSGRVEEGVPPFVPPIPPKNPTEDRSSPYFLSSQDLPGLVLTTVVFRGNNYDAWSKSLLLSLVTRRKMRFIEGTVEKPTDPEGLESWDVVQGTMVHWIRNTIDPSVIEKLPHFTEVLPLWECLKKRYGGSSATRKQDLKKALANVSQGTMSVDDYIGTLQKLWDAMNNQDPLPVCPCGGHEIQEILLKRRENDQFHDFMLGLNMAKFGSIRSFILSQEPLPDLDRAFDIVREDERVQNSSQVSEISSDVMTLALRGPVKSGGGGNNSKVCHYCKKKGHEVANCYAKYGYPGSSERRGGGEAVRCTLNMYIRKNWTSDLRGDFAPLFILCCLDLGLDSDPVLLMIL